jgi:hypothetical protein
MGLLFFSFLFRHQAHGRGSVYRVPKERVACRPCMPTLRRAVSNNIAIRRPDLKEVGVPDPRAHRLGRQLALLKPTDSDRGARALHYEPAFLVWSRGPQRHGRQGSDEVPDPRDQGRSFHELSATPVSGRKARLGIETSLSLPSLHTSHLLSCALVCHDHHDQRFHTSHTRTPRVWGQTALIS